MIDDKLKCQRRAEDRDQQDHQGGSRVAREDLGEQPDLAAQQQDGAHDGHRPHLKGKHDERQTEETNPSECQAVED
jgi:hypothetical protein